MRVGMMVAIAGRSTPGRVRSFRVAAATAAVEPTTAPVPTAPAATATAVPAETVPDPSAEEATPPSFPAITLATSTGGQIDFGSLQGQDTVLWFWAPW